MFIHNFMTCLFILNHEFKISRDIYIYSSFRCSLLTELGYILSSQRLVGFLLVADETVILATYQTELNDILSVF